MKTQLLIEIDCDEQHCGKCSFRLDDCCMLDAYWDDNYKEYIGTVLESEITDYAPDGITKEPLRPPFCLEAQLKAEGRKPL